MLIENELSFKEVCSFSSILWTSIQKESILGHGLLSLAVFLFFLFTIDRQADNKQSMSTENVSFFHTGRISFTIGPVWVFQLFLVLQEPAGTHQENAGHFLSTGIETLTAQA